MSVTNHLYMYYKTATIPTQPNK